MTQQYDTDTDIDDDTDTDSADNGDRPRNPASGSDQSATSGDSFHVRSPDSSAAPAPPPRPSMAAATTAAAVPAPAPLGAATTRPDLQGLGIHPASGPGTSTANANADADAESTPASDTTPRKSSRNPELKELAASPFPHLTNYIRGLLASVPAPGSVGAASVGSGSGTGISPPRTSTHPHPHPHPLSVSSSGESDEDTPPASRDEVGLKLRAGADAGAGAGSGSEGGQDRDGVGYASPVSVRGTPNEVALVREIITLLDAEEEEKVKELLRPHLGELAEDEILMEQVCLDCMHRRRDDIEQLPFTPAHLTPSRPRLSPSITAPLRPYTPSRVPSFRARTPLGRPHSPVPPASGGLTPTGVLPSGFNPGIPPAFSRSESAQRLPTLGLGLGATSPGLNGPSTLGLSAKATAFNPSPRLVSPSIAPPSAGIGGHTWIPADAWKDAPAEPPRTASPFAPGMTRTGSNLAIAAPLFSDQSSPFHSPLGTPLKAGIKIPDVFSSPSPSLSPAARPGMVRTASVKAAMPEDDDDDEFSPFGSGLPRLHHHHHDSVEHALNTGAKPFEPAFGAFGMAQSNSQTGLGIGHSGSLGGGPAARIPSSSSHGSLALSAASAAPDEEDGGAGMTPLDVLHQVFTGVPRAELEAALHQAGYDFETAMGLLVAQHTGPRSGASTPGRTSSPRPLMGIGGRGAVPTGFSAPSTGYFNQGGRGFVPGGGGGGGGLGLGQGPGGGGAGSMHGHGARTPGGLKMCRFFLNGECRRYDCRFSHDLDRALCRFWLRGNCAKGPNCEFLHQLPPNMSQFDPHALSNAMSRLELGSDGAFNSHHGHGNPHGGNMGMGGPGMHGPMEDFPDLMGGRMRPAGRFDPSRNRFANALKRAHAPPEQRHHVQITGARVGITPSLAPPPAAPAAPHAPPVPRASTRIKLRAPTLLPTISTGAATNEQYLAARQAAIRLGHARNACLARAADAFRRGDGAAAKRFSREGRSLNERMLAETAEAAAGLVRERRGDVQRAIRERDPAWSEDSEDRRVRGHEAGGGLGAVLGVAGRRALGALGLAGVEGMSVEERMECVLDLHTLHGGEGVDVLGAFLADLEKERYRGLAYVLVGEEKHVGMQDPARGASRVRLALSVRQYLADEGFPWMDGKGWICVDSCRS